MSAPRRVSSPSSTARFLEALKEHFGAMGDSERKKKIQAGHELVLEREAAASAKQSRHATTPKRAASR